MEEEEQEEQEEEKVKNKLEFVQSKAVNEVDAAHDRATPALRLMMASGMSGRGFHC
jgi:hypothetical protein